MRQFWRLLDGLFLNQRSLRRTLMALLAVWLVLATFFIGLSLNTSWRLEERGVAINEAGSLRKRVFHMVLLAEQPRDQAAIQAEYQTFEDIIHKLKNMPTNGFYNSDEYRRMHAQLDQLNADFQVFWQELSGYRQQRVSSAQLLQKAETFTGSINEFVRLIEQDNTRNIEWLRWFQAALLVLACLSAAASLYLLNYLVIQPLQKINSGIRNVEHGDFNSRVHIAGVNEFGRLAEGFNVMTARLHDVYGNLERLVNEKTHALTQKNHELGVLYDMSSAFQQSQDQGALVDGFIRQMVAFVGARAGAVQIHNRHTQQLELAGSSGLPHEMAVGIRHFHCDAYPCRELLGAERQHIPTAHTAHPACAAYDVFAQCWSFAIRLKNEDIGILNLYTDDAESPAEEVRHLIHTACNQFAIALESLRLTQLDKEMAVLAERNLMAQGLHDSIAQSLSFLNMQVQLLEQALRAQQPAKVAQTLKFIHEGVQESYEDVRELLSNFRVRMDQASLNEAVKTVVSRFESQTALPVTVQIQGEPFEADPEAQLQIVFILQEALSNVRKHAQASAVRMVLSYGAKDVLLRISDNGVGFDDMVLHQKEQQGHVGTSIMRERAAKIDGILSLQSVPGQGTTVTLCVPRHNIRD